MPSGTAGELADGVLGAVQGVGDLGVREPEGLLSTNTARSSGESDSRTTSTASDTESARTARSAASGTVGPNSVTTGSGNQGPVYDSRRDRRCRSRSMASRVVIRTRKALGSRTSSRAAADHLSQAS